MELIRYINIQPSDNHCDVEAAMADRWQHMVHLSLGIPSPTCFLHAKKLNFKGLGRLYLIIEIKMSDVRMRLHKYIIKEDSATRCFQCSKYKQGRLMVTCE